MFSNFQGSKVVERRNLEIFSGLRAGSWIRKIRRFANGLEFGFWNNWILKYPSRMVPEYWISRFRRYLVYKAFQLLNDYVGEIIIKQKIFEFQMFRVINIGAIVLPDLSRYWNYENSNMKWRILEFKAILKYLRYMNSRTSELLQLINYFSNSTWFSNNLNSQGNSNSEVLN